jgi:GAF domain-containing protein
MRRRSSSAVDQETKVARLTRELHEALEQQTATAKVLQVISRSTFDLQPVLDTLVESATRLCEAYDSVILLRDGERLRVRAHYGPMPVDFVDWPIGRGWVTGRVFIDHKPIHVHDLQAAVDEYPDGSAMAIRLGHRTILVTPLMREDEAIGALVVRRTEVRPFTDKQIELVTTFADQAVIAIENTRLLNELRQSLEQQTATADVLEVISRSAFDLQMVLDTLVESATRLCEAQDAFIFLPSGDLYRVAARYGFTPEFHEFIKSNPITIDQGSVVGRTAIDGRLVHISDVLSDPKYTRHDGQKVGGFRAALGVPLLRERNVVGVIFLTRTKPQPFTDKQIELVQTFADQAVIAIENVRLFDDVQKRTRELTEALEQQTATSEVLQVISSSPGDLQPVFETMLEKAVRICDAKFGTLYLRDADAYRAVAIHNAPPAYVEARKRDLVRPPPDSALGQIAKTRKVAHVADITAVKSYIERDSYLVAAVELGGYRTIVAVPMLKDNELIGAITICRQAVQPFSDKQIALLTNFAAQAVIAIENTRLLKELTKLNQQLEQRVADQVGEIERMGRLRRFLPPQVADLIVASGTERQLESHRREITALFCDLRGFTGFSESSDPEDVMALLRDYHAAIGETIIKYSGTLERYAGDGVMVVFNDPVPVEKPALQAVLMALEMRDVIGTLTEKWRRLGHDIGFGIGIAHGFATLGTIGFEGRFDYAAIGTVSNVASRLCDEAKPGQILISPRVLMAVEDAVTVEPVGEFALKGIRRPLAAYNVLATNREN